MENLMAMCPGGNIARQIAIQVVSETLQGASTMTFNDWCQVTTQNGNK